MTRVVLVGEVLSHRSFNGANKALPVLASALSQAGHDDVVQLDMERHDVDIDTVLRASEHADLVAFAGCMSPQWPQLDQSTARVRAHLDACGNRACPIVVGGYAAHGVERVARASPAIDAFFKGEGEHAVVRLVEAVADGSYRHARERIEGLCFVRPDGRWHESIAPRVRDLDPYDQSFGMVRIPELHDMDIFQAEDGRQLRTAQIFTQRGCPWRCGYCNKSLESNQVVRLSEPALRAQLQGLVDRGVEAVYLDVDTFTVSMDRALAEARLLVEYGLRWGSNSRVDAIDPSSLVEFARLGCDYLFFGVEHVLPEVLLAIGKFNGSVRRQLERARAYAPKVERVFKAMKQASLPSSFFVILGLPKAVIDDEGEQVVDYVPTTFEDDMQAILFGLDRCEPAYLNFNMLRFMPGTAAADWYGHPAFSTIRPSGKAPIDAAWFLPRLRESLGLGRAPYHPVYRLCESIESSQPATTAVDPERVYDSVRATMEHINRRIAAGRPATRLFIDRGIVEQGLVRRGPEGRYSMAPMKEFEAL